MSFIKNKTFEYVFVFLFIIVLFTAVASYFYYKSDNAVGPNLITAFVGVVLSALVTLILLNGQTKDEEAKEKNIKVFENKIQVYSEFISKMWKTMEDDVITDEEIRGIRLDIFNKLIFYFDDIDKLVGLVNEIKSSDDSEDNAKRTSETIQCFSEITELLRKDVDDRKAGKSELISQLWNKFALQPRDFDDDKKDKNMKDDIITSQSPITQQDIQTPKEPERLKQQAWHFIMWSDKQLEKLKERFKELSLVEYGEYWRTNLVKQVGKNDVIMLFRRGGYGYVGAYKAVGWRIFYFEEKREEIHIFGKELQVITGEQYLSDIKEYDIYESQKDGATTCANIIIEPIAFVENGVGNPGGVYRRTISRYDSHYAWLLMERFEKAQEKN